MITITALGLAAALAQAAPCESLRTLSLPNTTITSAQLVAAGPYVAPAPGGPPGGPVAPGAGRGDGRGGGRGDGAAAGGRGDGAAAAAGRGAGGGRGGAAAAPAGPVLPAHCRVAATLKPSSDSVIDIEVWMPESARWNGKFQMVGNGGWAGVISYAAMATAVGEGYATASTDTGHKGGNALFAIDHPEKLTDFAYRAVHETVVAAKSTITKYYERGPRLSYWNGCSTGGRQGLMSAQRYPEDFDAILAGAPANYQTHLHAWDLTVSTPVLKDTAGAVPAAKLDLVNKAVLNACDAKDGVADGVLNDPTKCTFEVASLQCKAGDPSTSLGAGADSCLTAPQVAAMKRVYEPVKTSSGQVVFPGKVPGAESGFGAYIAGQNAPGISVGSFQVAYNDAKWDWKTFDVNKDLPIVDQKVGAIVNAVNPDLSKFKARGGKLLMYHGWNDTAISPGNAIDYYSSVQKKMGGKQDDFIRLFMAPGMNHCGGGPGPNLVNWMASLERWRESGIAPDRIDAVRLGNNRVEVSRPLCAYPQVAVYSGKGTTNDAGNFSCKNP